MSYKIQFLLQKIAITVFAIFMGFLLVLTSIAYENVDTISAALGQYNAKLVDIDPDPNADLEYYKSDYESIRELVYAGFQIQEKVQAEGTVLLKNENNALPLARGSKVSVFGVSSALPFYGASGSGGINTTDAISWYNAFRGFYHDPEDPKEKLQGTKLLDINEELAT